MLPAGPHRRPAAAGRAGGAAAAPSRRPDRRPGAPWRVFLRPGDPAASGRPGGRGAAPRALPGPRLQPGAHDPRARAASPRARAPGPAGGPLAPRASRPSWPSMPGTPARRFTICNSATTASSASPTGRRRRSRTAEVRAAPGAWLPEDVPVLVVREEPGVKAHRLFLRAHPAPLPRLRRRPGPALVVSAGAELPDLRASVRAGRRRATGSAPTCSTSWRRNCSSPHWGWRSSSPPGRRRPGGLLTVGGVDPDGRRAVRLSPVLEDALPGVRPLFSSPRRGGFRRTTRARRRPAGVTTPPRSRHAPCLVRARPVVRSSSPPAPPPRRPRRRPSARSPALTPRRRAPASSCRRSTPSATRWSGSAGTAAPGPGPRTAAATWTTGVVPGADSLQFRDLHAHRCASASG